MQGKRGAAPGKPGEPAPSQGGCRGRGCPPGHFLPRRHPAMAQVRREAPDAPRPLPAFRAPGLPGVSVLSVFPRSAFRVFRGALQGARRNTRGSWRRQGTGFPCRVAGRNRHFFTAIRAASSKYPGGVAERTSIFVGLPWASTTNSRSTCPESPRRRARGGYSPWIPPWGTGRLSTWLAS